MELKLKEGVKLTNLMPKKRIITSTLEMVGEQDNYTETDIKLYLMLSIMNEMIEGNILVYCLADEKQLEDRITKEIEPLFNNLLKERNGLLEIYDELFNEIKAYLERERINNLSLVGLGNKVINTLLQIDFDKLVDTITSIKKEEQEGEKKKIALEQKSEIDDKMKDLINKFTKETNNNTTEK